jgi:hypothetical protein
MSSAAGKYTDFTAHFSGFRLQGLPGSPVPTSIPWVDDGVGAPKVQASGNKTSNPASLKWRLVVNAAVIFSSRISTKLVQSVKE